MKYLLKEWHRVTQENRDQEFSLSVDLCVSRTRDVCIITFVILLKSHALKTWRVYRHVKSFCWQCLTQTLRIVKLQSKYISISVMTCKYDLCCEGHSTLRLLSLMFFQIPPNPSHRIALYQSFPYLVPLFFQLILKMDLRKIKILLYFTGLNGTSFNLITRNSF